VYTLYTNVFECELPEPGCRYTGVFTMVLIMREDVPKSIINSKWSVMLMSYTHSVLYWIEMYYFAAQEFGLFLSDEDPKKGVWLESARTLEYYLLRNGVWCNLFSSFSSDITDIVKQCFLQFCQQQLW